MNQTNEWYDRLAMNQNANVAQVEVVEAGQMRRRLTQTGLVAGIGSGQSLVADGAVASGGSDGTHVGQAPAKWCGTELADPSKGRLEPDDSAKSGGDTNGATIYQNG